MTEPRHTFFKNLLSGQKGRYVEVGTCFGGFADFLLANTPAEHLTCIDPYRKWADDHYADSLNGYSDAENDQKYLQVFCRLYGKYGTRVSMMRSPSVLSASAFADNSLSFIYIDANHSCAAVLEDISAWISKLAPGGIIAGDDVEDIAAPHDADGNLKIVHKTGAYGLYGVHYALEKLKRDNPWFDYSVEGGQFWWRRPA
jgi:predicted O-methyltransferase YrrM